ncbi:hypothetical protein [Paenarthrobacter sp. PH39-S1]|uniref:hypothetical protein n=1 Tax=Paenarthrobacter sp. PH39-S1 TaxID=3046204 RepID=UPI0024B8E8F6|nr:hypothetical protein [Paenarthrobacter sp. PH39-S1]MDJ0355917.1 hypothetical protein [Paenarthrobacter sp. PH39-S1]
MASQDDRGEEPPLPVQGSSGARSAAQGEDENRRGSSEELAPGEVTQDAKGLGAIFGDADRSASDDPVKPPSEAEAASMAEMDKKFTSHESESGEKYLTEGD